MLKYEDADKMIRKERDAQGKRAALWFGCATAVVLACGIIGINHEKAKQEEKERTEARAKAFAQYLIDGAYADAVNNVREKKYAHVRNVARIQSEYDINGLKEQIQKLEADSTACAREIGYCAPLINEIVTAVGEKEVDFKTGWYYINSMPTEWAGMAYKPVKLRGSRMPEATVVYGITPAGILIDHRQAMTNICKDLIIHREALARKTR